MCCWKCEQVTDAVFQQTGFCHVIFLQFFFLHLGVFLHLPLILSLSLCVCLCECNAMWLGWRWVSWMCAGLMASCWGQKGGRSEQGRAGLAACSLGVLMLLADPCAQREADRRACLIHERPAEVLWGIWLHCPFSAELKRTTLEPRGGSV